MNKDGFKPNLETHLNPLLATKHDDSSSESKDKSSSKDYHHPLLMQVVNITFNDKEKTLSVDLCFYYV